MNTALHIAAIILSYLIGAIPFGLLFTRWFSDIDVRTVGSGNIGATNVLRAAGKKAALLTLLADCLKGLLPVLAIKLLLNDEHTSMLSGTAALLGHTFPVYLGFKGGKGVATSFGVALALTPLAALASLITWALAAFIWRYSSLAALAAFALYPLYTFSLYPSQDLRLLSLVLFGMIYAKHRENIKRLIARTESKIGKK
jgi:acyl phosphate:glycerol-3-phosphate acyltransferase